ncbi:hypothetical protein JCM5296_002910 [Sporobolomyces johnsonii]
MGPPRPQEANPQALPYKARLNRTNDFIHLANSSECALAAEQLAREFAAANDESNPAMSVVYSSPTFEALNRCTYAYALARLKQHDAARRELERVVQLIEEDAGRTEYFSKIRDRARRVCRRKGMGEVRGLTDQSTAQDETARSYLHRTPRPPSPPTEELGDAFAVLKLAEQD